jgi:hypothetical protein
MVTLDSAQVRLTAHDDGLSPWNRASVRLGATQRFHKKSGTAQRALQFCPGLPNHTAS